MEHMVMIVPKDRDIGKAERIRQEHRQTGPERRKVRPLRQFHAKDHDGKNNGNHSVRECLKPLLAQPRPLSLGFAPDVRAGKWPPG
jgi:hypothetical protein